MIEQEQNDEAQATMSVYKKLQSARVELQTHEVKKSGYNKHLTYQYFTLEDFLPTINSILDKHGLCGVVSFTAEQASLKIVDVDDTANEIIFTSPVADAALRGCTPAQNLGATITYIRRYLWNLAFEIAEHDALDLNTKGDTDKGKGATPNGGTWEGMDAETQNWMLNEAMTVADMISKDDIEGAVQHIDSLGLQDTYRIAFDTRLDSKQRASIKAYLSIIRADNLDKLIDAWSNVPKYAQNALVKYKDAQKTKLMEQTNDS